MNLKQSNVGRKNAIEKEKKKKIINKTEMDTIGNSLLIVHKRCH